MRAPPSPPCSSIASSAPAPPSVVAEPPTPTHDDARARVDRGADELAGPVRGGRPGVALVLGHEASPDAAAISRTAVPPSSTSANWAVSGRPSGSCTLGARQLAAEAGEQRVERALAAVGHRAEVGRHEPGALQAAADRAATSEARNVPLKESGATSTGRSGTEAIAASVARRCVRATIERVLRRADAQLSRGARRDTLPPPWTPPSARRAEARWVPDDSSLLALQGALGVVGAKWSLSVLASLHDGTQRFNELLRQIDGVSRRMLSATLRQLERDGLVLRHVYARVPARVEYELSDSGEALLLALTPLLDWGKLHQDEIAAARERFDRLQLWRTAAQELEAQSAHAPRSACPASTREPHRELAEPQLVARPHLRLHDAAAVHPRCRWGALVAHEPGAVADVQDGVGRETESSAKTSWQRALRPSSMAAPASPAASGSASAGAGAAGRRDATGAAAGATAARPRGRP